MEGALHLRVCHKTCSSSFGRVLKPDGYLKTAGIISVRSEGPSDPKWNDDPGMKEFLYIHGEGFPEGDKLDGSTVVGYGVAQTG